MADGQSVQKQITGDRRTISQRIDVLEKFIRFANHLPPIRSRKASARVLLDIIDDVLSSHVLRTYTESDQVPDELNDRLDPKTIRKVLSADLEVEVFSFSPTTLNVLDAFLRIVEVNEPAYLRRIRLNAGQKQQSNGSEPR